MNDQSHAQKIISSFHKLEKLGANVYIAEVESIPSQAGTVFITGNHEGDEVKTWNFRATYNYQMDLNACLAINIPKDKINNQMINVSLVKSFKQVIYRHKICLETQKKKESQMKEPTSWCDAVKMFESDLISTSDPFTSVKGELMIDPSKEVSDVGFTRLKSNPTKDCLCQDEKDRFFSARLIHKENHSQLQFRIFRTSKDYKGCKLSICVSIGDMRVYSFPITVKTTTKFPKLPSEKQPLLKAVYDAYEKGGAELLAVAVFQLVQQKQCLGQLVQLISKAPQSSSSSRDVGRRLAVDIAGNAVSDQPLVGGPSPSSLLAIYPSEDNGSDESYQSSPDPRIWMQLPTLGQTSNNEPSTSSQTPSPPQELQQVISQVSNSGNSSEFSLEDEYIYDAFDSNTNNELSTSSQTPSPPQELQQVISQGFNRGYSDQESDEMNSDINDSNSEDLSEVLGVLQPDIADDASQSPSKQMKLDDRSSSSTSDLNVVQVFKDINSSDFQAICNHCKKNIFNN